ncbi:hypothetical protein C8J57DRAFT_1540418 [Mycena rebaudengoi]|nr:hypothetical protein C8J57DRAFT_1540418 [Mycena rebaudengoi]
MYCATTTSPQTRYIVPALCARSTCDAGVPPRRRFRRVIRNPRLFLSHIANRSPRIPYTANHDTHMRSARGSLPSSLGQPLLRLATTTFSTALVSQYDTPPRISSFRQRPSRSPPPCTTHITTRTPAAVSSASGGRSSPPRRLLSQCEPLLQISALVALPRPSAPQSTPPACAATAVAVPHFIRLLRRIPKTTHRTSMPGTGGSPFPSHAPRSSPARPSSSMIFAPTAPPLPLAHGALLTRRINSRHRRTLPRTAGAMCPAARMHSAPRFSAAAMQLVRARFSARSSKPARTTPRRHDEQREGRRGADAGALDLTSCPYRHDPERAQQFSPLFWLCRAAARGCVYAD